MKYFLLEQVATHNKAHDFWVIMHRNILDLTSVLEEHRKHGIGNMKYLLSFGGKDMSRFFDPNGIPIGDAATEAGLDRLFLSSPSAGDVDGMKYMRGCMWSQNPMYRIGRITRRPRQLRVVNTITGNTVFLDHCNEDTILDIQHKFAARFGKPDVDYIWWKSAMRNDRDGQLLLNATLDENGLFDEEIDTYTLRPPTIWLYSN